MPPLEVLSRCFACSSGGIGFAPYVIWVEFASKLSMRSYFLSRFRHSSSQMMLANLFIVFSFTLRFFITWNYFISVIFDWAIAIWVTWTYVVVVFLLFCLSQFLCHNCLNDSLHFVGGCIYDSTCWFNQVFSCINEFTLYKLQIQITALRWKIYGINPVSNWI